ncbi:MAG: fucose permease [Acidimicrobiales bacterium]
MTHRIRPQRARGVKLVSRRLVVTFALYVLLGLPEGVLGTAWPQIQTTFGREINGLSSVIVAYTLAYLVSTFGSGRLTELFGVERGTQIGAGLTTAGLVGYVLSPAWPLFLLSALVIGAGAGTVDSVVNADIAVRYGQRVMHLLHASFGIGATLGPLLVASLVSAGVSWRLAYGALAVSESLLLLSLFTLADQRAAELDTDSLQSRAASAARPNLALAATLVYFGIYVGAEVSAGQWSYSILTNDRGLSGFVAGFAVAGYWFGLTVGRLALSALDHRLAEMTLLRSASVVSVLAAIWFWIDIPGSTLALPVLGFAFAGIFPSLVLLTPGWLGARRVARAVGYQLAASSAGAIIVSLAIGRVAKNNGLDAVPATFVVLCILMAVAHVFTEWATRP